MFCYCVVTCTTCKLEMLLQAFAGYSTVPLQTSFVIHALAIQLFFWCSYLKIVGSNYVNVTCVLGT
jgi:hypothetical protein